MTQHDPLNDNCARDTLMIWADGTMAYQSEIDDGDFSYMSDDYRPATKDEIEAWHADSVEPSLGHA